MKAEMCVHCQREEYEQAKHKGFNNPEFGWGSEKCLHFLISQARYPVKLENIKQFCE